VHFWRDLLSGELGHLVPTLSPPTWLCISVLQDII
jgi:hypothetical protein